MQQRAAYLLERYITGSINDAEMAELQELTESSAPEVQQGIQQWLEGREADPAYNPQQWQHVLGHIISADRQEEKNRKTVPMYKRSWFRYAAAAAVVIVAGLGFWRSNEKIEKETISPQPIVQKEVPPGKDGAILTLADGTTLVLDSMGNGVVASQNGTQVVLKDGKLAYYGGATDIAVAYNTMTTPRGRQFNVTLPDGTRVWLNAASSLRYPTVFNGTERKVQITGEAYFEVAQNKNQPFKVETGKGIEVEVLGTHFNVNSYDDEPTINTTLLEGSVKVVAKNSPQENGNSVVLRPGQQAQNSNTEDGKGLRIRQVDLDEVVAWKDGAFSFNDADLKAVMRQLSRWYDVEVEYAGEISEQQRFTGKLGRSIPLADLLAEMKDYDVKFRIEGGNKIVVLP
ncbi:FecR family protein [Pseudobacter ginsenosidimutans]|uniref:FecR family protein n=1 Tax=Pseudobacter ginsenosidimutans TaxID=661488 RepID=A0A4Q7N1W9_9BACT|nr:FecR domain-containing protein [Pseudobacter ginsenosidimutans]RZS74614.1 FecR family protein [Pseudobacter ginsenosidimutans]